VFAKATDSTLGESVAFCSEYPRMFDAAFTTLGSNGKRFAESSKSAAERIRKEREQWKLEHLETA
jgi:hypothetical protein